MAEEFTLLIVKTRGIQDYIYGSNRLKENIGAAYLMNVAVNDWALDILYDLTGLDCHGLEQPIEGDPNQPLELIDLGGGAIILLFRKTFDEICKEFNRNLSQKILLDAPDLPITFYSLPYIWDDNPNSEGLAITHHQLMLDIKKGKGNQLTYRGFFGLGVTAACQSTSLPATILGHNSDVDNTPTRLSVEAHTKQQSALLANKKIQNSLIYESERYTFPLELDHLGRAENDQSMMAVVSMDGNNLGTQIDAINDRFPTVGQNRTFINTLRTVSKTLQEVNRHGQQAMIDLLQRAIIPHTQTPQIDGNIPITLKQADGDQYYFPLRPLEAGGDDMTFVCDGRIAFDLAITYLQAFESEAQNKLCQLLDVEQITAAAGIAIVNVHYPFARAYSLSVDLLKSAKGRSRTQASLDWHFTTGGLYGDIDGIRKREYEVDDGNLTLRPVLLNDTDDTYHSWSFIKDKLDYFQSDDKWQKSRNKAKGLMNALRQGRNETIRFRKRYLSEAGDPKLPPVPYISKRGDPKKSRTGWISGQCVYYDALELLDLYVPLASREEAHNG